MVTNGQYSDDSIKDFLNYYSDLITVNSLHPDFARMSEKTQRFLSMLFDMLKVSDVTSDTELLNSIVSEKNYLFKIIKRNEILFISILYDKHQYYLLPRHEMAKIKSTL
jgi:signal transduction histidine kinase